jgi:hypothetical protein
MELSAAGIAAASGITSGKAAADAGKQNADMMRMQARDALARGDLEESRHRRQTRALAGSQMAALAANGVQGGTGTAARLVEDTFMLGEEDALTIRNNAARDAWGLNQQANITEKQGKQAKTAAIFSGGVTALTHGAQAYQYRKLR